MANMSVVKIAEQLGLNASTVSRALNNRYGVSEKTRQRVLSHVSESSDTARRGGGGRPTRSRTLGVIVPNCSSDFFSTFISGVESVVSMGDDLLALGVSRYDRFREDRL